MDRSNFDNNESAILPISPVINHSTAQPLNPSTKHLISYILHLADNALILGHRNSEWCGHGPILEQDIALTNIALDLVGQARNYYQYAAELINAAIAPSPGGEGVGGEAYTEDTLAYLRDEQDFKNCLLVEQPNGDWGVTVMRQFFFSTYQYHLYQQLQYSNDNRIAAIATKALKEVTYHVRWSSEWVIRLGAGTEESHRRMLNAVSTLQQFTGELFIPASYETVAAMENFGVDVALINPLWQKDITNVFAKANLNETLPLHNIPAAAGGKDGLHSEYLCHILAEMQVLQRAYPGAKW